MNSKSRYELAASVCRGKVWLDNTALAAISRMYRKRIENATSKLEATVEQGRYASFRIDQALDHPKASRLVLGEFYQFNLSSCIRQQNSLTAQFVSFSLSNLANIFYPPNFYNN